jgi:soluble lytic murein transglycosylase-like protein
MGCLLRRILAVCCAAQGVVFVAAAGAEENSGPGQLHALIARHAQANGLPVDLVHHVVRKESNYNAQARGRGGVLGLMQIKYGTARALGYAGSPSGLLDADTNLTYAVKYLAGAYRAANSDHSRAMRYYASGYYYAAKRQRRHAEPVLASAPPKDGARFPMDADAPVPAK